MFNRPNSSSAATSSAQHPASGSVHRVGLNFIAFKTHHGLYWLAAMLFLLGGATYAVSSLNAPKPQVTQHELQELLNPPGVAAQLNSVLNAGKEMRLYRAETTRSSDTVESLFLRLGVDDQQAASIIRANVQLRRNLLGKSSRPVKVEVDSQNKLLSLKLIWSTSESTYTLMELTRQASPESEAINSNSVFQLHQSILPLHTTVRFASARIQTSLFAATDAAQIPDSVAAQLAEVFASEIDFHRTLQKGDHFTLLYEALDADGEPMGYGKLLGAEFVSAGVAHRAMYFKDKGASEGNYFNLKGQSLKRTYLAAPLKFSRITSGYKMRFHPILQTWKAHKGIDYSAPIGTPVHTVGKGVVRVAGYMNGLGNVVFVDHSNSQTTVYAHLNQFKVKAGQTVEQGQLIGTVGETGWATGPHLHFEFRISDQYKDPSTIARQSVPIVLSGAAKALFDKQAQEFLIQIGSTGNSGDDQVSFLQ